MRLQQLQLLLVLAQTGSLRASAEMLHVSQPALTKSLRQLEDEFGTTLVLRTAKGVRLAPAGEMLAARAATVMRELGRAREEIGWHTEHAQASVTVGLSPGGAILLGPGALARFRARWPQVRIRLVDTLYPRMFAQLRAGELDLAIGPLPVEGARRDLAIHPIFTSRNLIAARRGHPLADRTRLADLVQAAWVLTGPAGGPGDPRRMDFESRGLPAPDVRLECESFSTLLAILPDLDILGVVPEGFFQRHGPAMNLVALPIADDLPATTIHLVARADAPLTVPAQRLYEAFEQEARGLRADVQPARVRRRRA